METSSGRHDPVAVAKRALFLAYKASKVLGMGRFQAVENATEEEVWNAAVNATDYGGSPFMKGSRPGLRADYVFGRQIKIDFEWSESGLTLNCFDPEVPWRVTYFSAIQLVVRATKDLDEKQ